jgi:cytochrome c oxidase subunit II
MRMILFIALFVLCLSMTACSKHDSDTQDTEFREFKIIAKDFAFTPDTITVNQGDNVRIIAQSNDVTHGISIPDYGINKRLDPGNTVVIEFTADKVGTFEFFCSTYCGEGHGNMKGKIIVE